MSGLSREDRARLEGLLDYLQRTEDHPQAKADVDVFARALALIDQQEKALEAADELARHYDIDSAPEKTLDAYRSARTTEGGRNDG